nr:unnamed protein product [Callosobruchus chinensis]
MENILNKDTEHQNMISDVKSEEDNMECEELHDGRNIVEYQKSHLSELGAEIEENAVKHEFPSDMTIKDEPLTQKQEDMLDLGADIILPQTSQSASSQPPKLKKEIKSKKELEEEEREKMQYVKYIKSYNERVKYVISCHNRFLKR